MFYRLIRPLFSNSFFLFGARGTGKTTYLQATAKLAKAEVHVVDLLDPELENRYSRKPNLLLAELEALKKKPDIVILDEIQKVPKLLNLVQKLIQEQKYKFILTGSSSRKLKRQGSNLLAGRAFVYHLHPLTQTELATSFDLSNVLHWGTLPQIYSFKSDAEKTAYLRSYALTFIKEEIQAEQLIRDLDPFREFLPICAQMNGKILNFKKIADEIGVDYKTVQKYYSILEDTWVGFFLPAYSRSIRKAQRTHPKFYLFDPGVKRALDETMEVKLRERTSAYGEAFEHWVMLEFYRHNEYSLKNYRMSYLCTKDGLEIDLILSKAGVNPIAIEIKSTDKVDEIEVRKLEKLSSDLGNPKIYYLSRDPVAKKIGKVHCLPWSDGISEILK